MPANNRKISYIRKPLARRGFPSVGAAAAALLCCIVSLGLSVARQGNGGLNVAAWGLTSILFSAVSLWYGLSAFAEQEKNYILAKTGAVTGGILLVFWIIMVIVGLLR
ncbi:MAG: DUF6142 family protein [Eubacteriales bacterium]|nr:DUF6142 family protein [Eubacteriales bacterium]